MDYQESRNYNLNDKVNMMHSVHEKNDCCHENNSNNNKNTIIHQLQTKFSRFVT